MQSFKALAIYAMASFGIGDGGGIGLVGAVASAFFEEDKGVGMNQDDTSTSLPIKTDENLVPRGGDTKVYLASDALDTRTSSANALRGINKLAGALSSAADEVVTTSEDVVGTFGGFVEPQTSQTTVKLGKADMPGFKMHKELADFFEMIEDEEKYAKWEKEQMPKTLELIELARKTSNRGKKIKSWARKAIAKSEITSCWKKKTYKGVCVSVFAKPCRRYGYFFWQRVCVSWGCDRNERDILGCCHKDCNGDYDDGTHCVRNCGTNTVTPHSCSAYQCAVDGPACAGSIFNMIFSIVDMLSNLCPATKLAGLATKLAKRGLTLAAKKALVKEFAVSIAKELFKKAKSRAKRLMKQQVNGAITYMKESMVDAILQEAAEAFAIERVRTDPQFSGLSIEDVARELDVIGVSGVIDAFNLQSCEAAELETFPSCYVGQGYQGDYWGIYNWANENCCGDVSDWGWHSEWKVHFMYCHEPGLDELYAAYMSSSESPDESSPWESPDKMIDDDIFSGDDGFYSDPENTFVDHFIYNMTLSQDMLFLCTECAKHEACDAGDQFGLDSAFYDSCHASGCCSDKPPTTDAPDIDVHIKNLLKATHRDQVTDEEPHACDQCYFICDDSVNQEIYPEFYDHCASTGCCDESLTTSTTVGTPPAATAVFPAN